MKNRQVIAALLAGLLIIGLPSCSKPYIDDGSGGDGVGNSAIDDDLIFESSSGLSLPTEQWVDKDKEEAVKQSGFFRLSYVTGEATVKIGHHRDFVDAYATLNGKAFSNEGAEIVKDNESFSEYGTSYSASYEFDAYDVYDAQICFTPCEQTELGSYGVQYGGFYDSSCLSLSASVMSGKEIQFDQNNGILIKGVTGNWKAAIYIVRGCPIEIGYSDTLYLTGSAEEAADVLILFTPDGVTIESDQDITGFMAQIGNSESEQRYLPAESVKKEYAVRIEAVGNYLNDVIIE